MSKADNNYIRTKTNNELLAMVQDRDSWLPDEKAVARSELNRRGVEWGAPPMPKPPPKMKSGLPAPPKPPATGAEIMNLMESYRIDGERWKPFSEPGKPRVVMLHGEAPRGLYTKLKAMGWALRVDKRTNYERNEEDAPIEFTCRNIDRQVGERQAPKDLAAHRSARFRESRGWGKPEQVARAVGGLEADRGFDQRCEAVKVEPDFDGMGVEIPCMNTATRKAGNGVWVCDGCTPLLEGQ